MPDWGVGYQIAAERMRERGALNDALHDCSDSGHIVAPGYGNVIHSGRPDTPASGAGNYRCPDQAYPGPADRLTNALV